jgi:hypothetical protein
VEPVGVMAAQAQLEDRSARPRSRLRRVLVAALVLVVLWVVLGVVRAPAVARDYYRSKQGGAQVTDIEQVVFPALPPFWGVSIRGTITESTGTSYPSVMLLWVEPFSGVVVPMGAG